jgi:hypothetical protein
MNRKNHRGFFIIALPLLGISAWFGWMSYSQSTVDWFKAKVSEALIVNLENQAPQWPRLEYISSSGNYYSPNINDPIVRADLYRGVLAELNQDEKMPPVKISQVSIQKVIGVNDDLLTGQAVVRFTLIAGIQKEAIIQSSVRIPHYHSPQ